MISADSIGIKDGIDRSVVMFSGGRDSTLAVARLAEARQPLILVTVTSSHLVGIDRVSERVSELSSILPSDTAWLNVRQPEGVIRRYAPYERTCLPCHHLYVVVGMRIAALIDARAIAFGYAAYQNS